MKTVIRFLLPVVFLLSACETNITAAPNHPGISSSTPTVILTATQPAAPTITLSPTLPAVLSTPLPENLQTISASNVDKMVELARWGDGQLYGTRITSDGTRIIAILSTGIFVYDALTLKETGRAAISIIDQGMVAWALSSDGDLLAVLDENHKLAIWQTSDGKQLGWRQFSRDDLGCITQSDSLVFSPDNASLGIFGFCNGNESYSKLLLLRVSDLKELVKEEKSGLGLFSSDGKYLVTYRFFPEEIKKSVKVYRANNGSLVHELGGSKNIGCMNIYRDYGKSPWPPAWPWGNETSCLAFSPDGEVLAVGFIDATRLFNIAEGKEIGLYSSGRPWFSSDGKILLLQTDFGRSAGYEVATGKSLSYSADLDQPVLSSNGIYLAGTWTKTISAHSFETGGVVLYDLQTKKNVARFEDYKQYAFSSDSAFIVLYSKDEHQPMLLVRTSDAGVTQSLAAESAPAFLPDGKSLMTAGANEVFLRSLPDGKTKYAWRGIWPQILPDGQSVVTIDGDTISRWSTEDGSLLASQEFPVSPEGLTLVGDRLVETSVNGIRVLKLPNLTLEQSPGPRATFAPNGKLFVISKSTALEIWQFGSPPSLLKSVETGGHYRFLFSPDSKLLAIDKTDGRVEVWELEKGEVLQTFSAGANRRIEQMTFTPDHTRLYAITRRSFDTSYDVDTLIGWNLSDGSTLPTRDVKCNIPIAVSPDSTLLAYGGQVGSQHGRWRGCQVTIYRIEGWQPVQSIDEVTVSQMSFSPDNTLLAATSSSGGIRIWKLVDGQLLRTIVDNSFNNKLYTDAVLSEKAGYMPKGQFGISLSFSRDGKYLLRTADGVAYLWGVPAP